MQPTGRISIANLYKALITLNSRRKKPPPFQFYCTASINGDCDSDSVVDSDTHNVDDNGSIISNKPRKKKRGKPKETLYSKISPLGDLSCNVASLIDQWVKNGNQVRFAELQRIIRDFRKRKRFSQALQVSEWVKNKQGFTFSPVEHAVQIDLIGKVHGYPSAETYFNNLSEEDKTEKTYGALLHCYVRQHDTVKALSLLQSMKEKGLKLSSVVYNDLMSLYTHSDKYEMVLDLLSQMKEHGVTPDNMTYKICLNSYGQRSNIPGMEMLLDEMEQQPDVSVDWSTCALVANFYSKEGLTAKANDFLKLAEERLPVGNADGYNHLISLHANLGNKSEVFRLWCLEKNTCKKRVNMDYIHILKNLVRLNELEEAEKVLEEWESSGNYYDLRIPFIFIDKYIAKRQYVKAEGMLKDLIEKGKFPNADMWGRVVAGHLNLGNTTRAVECMKLALSSGKEKQWKPDRRLMTRLLDVLGVEEHATDNDTLVDTFLTRTILHGSDVDTLGDTCLTTRTSEENTNASSLNLKMGLEFLSILRAEDERLTKHEKLLSFCRTEPNRTES